MNVCKRLCVITALALSSVNAHAENLVMQRSVQPFPETMSTLQDSIRKQGYVVSRVQRVDIGLTKMGYKTDKYRVVFYGKPDEIKSLSAKHPELIPYLPLKIAIFSEDGETLLIAMNPKELELMYPDAELQAYFKRWSQDLTAIMHTIQTATD